jgi:hypothetical protein
LNAYSTSGAALTINSTRNFNLSSGNEIELKDNYILVKSIVSDENQNDVQVKIEKFVISDQNRLTNNNLIEPIIKVENPMREYLNIKNAENAVLFEIYDMNGRPVLISKTSENISTSKLLKGNYFLKITFKNGQTSSQKLLKI